MRQYSSLGSSVRTAGTLSLDAYFVMPHRGKMTFSVALAVIVPPLPLENKSYASKAKNLSQTPIVTNSGEESKK